MPCSGWDDRLKYCDKSVLTARLIQACKLRTRSQFFNLPTVRLNCEGVLLKDSTGTRISDARDDCSPATAAPVFVATVDHTMTTTILWARPMRRVPQSWTVPQLLTSSASDKHRQQRFRNVLVARKACVVHLEAEDCLQGAVRSAPVLRKDSATLAKQVACWEREAKRPRADSHLAQQERNKHG